MIREELFLIAFLTVFPVVIYLWILILKNSYCPYCQNAKLKIIFIKRKKDESISGDWFPKGSKKLVLKCDKCERIFEKLVFSLRNLDFKHKKFIIQRIENND